MTSVTSFKVSVETKSRGVLELALKPGETAASFKKRLEVIEPSALNADLVLSGTPLHGPERLSDLMSDSKSNKLALVARDLEVVLTQQLKDLLSARPLPLDELELMYSYRHGMKITEALKDLQLGLKLADFLSGHKLFRLTSEGLACVVDTAQPTVSDVEHTKTAICEHQPFEVFVSVILCASLMSKVAANVDDDAVVLRAGQDETVRSLKLRAATAELIPFAHQDLLGEDERILEDDALITSAAVRAGERLTLRVHASEASFVQQLVELLDSDAAVTSHDLSLRYNYRYGVSVIRAMRLVGVKGSFKDFLKKQECLSIDAGGVIHLCDLDAPTKV